MKDTLLDMRWYIFGGLMMLVVIVLGVFLSRIHKETLGTSTRHITLGAWTQGMFDPVTKQVHPEVLSAFEKEIHKNVSIAHYYIGWESLADPNLVMQFTTLRNNGWEPMLNVNPYFFSDCPASKTPLYKAIAEGDCDAFLHKAGKNLSTVTQPFYLLFAWEMNNDQNQWSVSYTGSTANDFIAAWRHIHTIFQQEGATHIVWVFCPNVPDDAQTPYTVLYPGNAYVNWIGLDGYNWGTTQSWSQWESFTDIFLGSYKKLVALAPAKPIMIAETNTTDQGGDKAAWYTNMFTQEIPLHFSRVQAIIIFNEDRTQQEHVNWNVDVTPQSLEAFISAIHTSWY